MLRIASSVVVAAVSLAIGRRRKAEAPAHA